MAGFALRFKLRRAIMPQIINTNIASLNAQRNLNKSQSANQTSLQRLSSGLRINSAKDDAAGLAISTRFNSQIRGLNVAVRNAGDGISLAQTAEGALGSMNDNLQRVRELAVQSANATNSDVDRDALQAEVSQLLSEVSRTADETDFNGRKLLDGSFSATFQIGANAGQTLDISIAELTADKLGASDSVGISSQGNDNAILNGDLLINDKQITPSKAADDSFSFAEAETSAIAKAAAINREYDETGVKAVVNENTVAGSEMVAAAVSGQVLNLNGVAITLSTTTSASQTRAGVTDAINAVSDQTGVTAVNSESDTGGVTLVAQDGRNITIDFSAGTLTAANTGLAAEDTHQGGFTLVADGDVSEVRISGGDGTGNGDIKNSGLQAGTYTTSQAQLTSSTVTEVDGVDLSTSFGGATGISLLGSQETATTTGIAFFGTGSMGAEVITVAAGGQTATIGTAGDVVILGSTGFGADALAAALNSMSGIEASAETKMHISGLALTSSGTLNFFDGGHSGGEVLQAVTVTSTSTLSDLATAINGNTAGTLVAEYLATTGGLSAVVGGELIVTDTAGNTILTRTTAAGVLNVRGYTETGGFAGAAVDVADDTNGLGLVTVGYINETNVTDDSITNISVTSNLSGSTAGTTTSGLVSSIFATAGANVAAGIDGSGINAVTASVSASLVGLTDGDLTINDVAIKAADPLKDTASATLASNGTDKIQTSTKQASAIAVAAAINDISSETGVTAEVNATTLVGSNTSTSTANAEGYAVGDAGKIYINGVDVGIVSLADDGSGGVDQDASRQSAIDAINAKAGQTGVTAEDNGKSITLSAADGRNISLAIDNDEANNTGSGVGFGALIGLDANVDGIGEADIGVATSSNVSGTRGTANEGATYETTYGTITLQSAKQIDIGVGNDGKDELDKLGLKAGTYGGGEDGQFLSEIDISTFEGATAALTAIDNAIGSIASQRADLGAIQNRMESTVSNLAITSENLSAANSRIQDADFAAETAELSRTQVLQQAGISILAQANQGPQQVLSLLG
jgi:flagellin